MTEVRNRSHLSKDALLVIRNAIAQLSHIDQIPTAAPTRIDFIRSVAYEDGTHDLVGASDSLVFSFGATCSGRLLSSTLWDRQPTDEELILDRLEGLNPGPSDGSTACRLGGHSLAASLH